MLVSITTYQMMLVSFNSNKTGVTSGVKISYPSVAPKFTPPTFCPQFLVWFVLLNL